MQGERRTLRSRELAQRVATGELQFPTRSECSSKGSSESLQLRAATLVPPAGSSESLQRRASSLPSLKPPSLERSLYEVASGIVAVRPAPSTACAATCVLKGGARFYGTPFQVGSSTWLRLQTENVAPPLFSGTGDAEQAWVRNDDQVIYHVRKGRKIMSDIAHPPQGTSAPRSSLADSTRRSILPSPKASLVEPHLADDTAIGGIRDDVAIGGMRESLIPGYDPHEFLVSHSVSQMGSSQARWSSMLTMEDWARCGTGAWCNFRGYGVHGGPANTNCGRWRQFPD